MTRYTVNVDGYAIGEIVTDPLTLNCRDYLRDAIAGHLNVSLRGVKITEAP